MQTNKGFTLEFPPDFDFVAQDIQKYGFWERRTTEFIEDNLKPGQVFIDVGAQVGYYSILAARIGARVHAFEPSTANRKYLEKNIADNAAQNITVYPYALSDINGSAHLYNGKTPGENSLLGSGEGEIVETVRFDKLDITPDMIKIDVEGAEKQVLLGMSKVLYAEKPIILIIEDWYNHVTDWLIDNYGFKLVGVDRAFGNRILAKNHIGDAPKMVKEPLRIHLVGPFNTPTTMADEGVGNAFAAKCVQMAKVLKKLGHYVIFYGVEGSEVACDEFVQVSTQNTLELCYGKRDPSRVYGCQRGDYAHKTFNENTIAEIKKRRLFGDFLLLCFGTYQQEIAEAVGIPDVVEIGVGYTGSFAKFRIFESEFIKNWTYGAEGRGDGNFYDTVIPGFFDPADFDYSEQKEDYYLYLGRVIARKGIFIAQQVTEAIGAKLVVAGFGYKPQDNSADAVAFEELLKKPNVKYVGFAGREKRRQLLAHAKAVFMPTTYLEAFGYVAIEAMLSGTPVITTEFGAFPETIKQGVTGFKCRSFAEFCKAAVDVGQIKPADCRAWALDRFTIDAVAPKYQAYFDHILTLYGKGWYA